MSSSFDPFRLVFSVFISHSVVIYTYCRCPGCEDQWPPSQIVGFPSQQDFRLPPWLWSWHRSPLRFNLVWFSVMEVKIILEALQQTLVGIRDHYYYYHHILPFSAGCNCECNWHHVSTEAISLTLYSYFSSLINITSTQHLSRHKISNQRRAWKHTERERERRPNHTLTRGLFTPGNPSSNQASVLA